MIGLDVAPVKARPTGVGRYVLELARAFDSHPAADYAAIGIRPRGALGDRAGEAGTSTFRGGHYIGWLLLHADRDARRLGCRLVHYTNGIAPPRTTRPFVLTIHDLSVIRMPRSHPLPRLASIPLLLMAARRAAHVIVPSEATAREAARVLRVPASRMSVVPHAARALVRSNDEPALLQRFDLTPGGYVASLATIEPRKNLARLVTAYELLARKHPGLRLVLVGDQGWRSGPLGRLIGASPVRDRIVVTGYLDDDAVASIVANAAVLAYPSLYEGYGLPVIEAMALGTPVVTSDRSSLPEVAGGAAVLVDPSRPEAIAAGIAEAIARSGDLREAGLRRVAERSWADVADETLAVYERVLRSAG